MLPGSECLWFILRDPSQVQIYRVFEAEWRTFCHAHAAGDDWAKLNESKCTSHIEKDRIAAHLLAIAWYSSVRNCNRQKTTPTLLSTASQSLPPNAQTCAILAEIWRLQKTQKSCFVAFCSKLLLSSSLIDWLSKQFFPLERRQGMQCWIQVFKMSPQSIFLNFASCICQYQMLRWGSALLSRQTCLGMADALLHPAGSCWLVQDLSSVQAWLSSCRHNDLSFADWP